MKKFIITAILISLVFLIPSLAMSQSCNVVRHGPIYSAPVYTPPIVQNVIKHDVVVKEIAVPYFVPAYQFQYQPPCFTEQHQQPSAAYGNGPPAVNSVNPANDLNRIQELAKALLQEMQKQQNDDNGPPVANAPVQNQINPQINPVQPNQNSGIPNGLTPSQAQPIAIAALQRNCASCHTGVGSKGDAIIFSQPGILDGNAPWKLMKREIESGRMPPKQSQFNPTPYEIQALRIWLGSL